MKELLKHVIFDQRERNLSKMQVEQDSYLKVLIYYSR